MVTLPIDATALAVRQAREKAKITQTAAALAIGISIAQLQRFEYGTREIPNWYIYALAAIVGEAAAPKKRPWRIGLIRHTEEIEYIEGNYAHATQAGEAARVTWPHARSFAIDTKGATFYAIALDPPARVHGG